MGDTSKTNTKVLSRELFLGVVALKTPIPQNHYLRDKVPFLKSGHILKTQNKNMGERAKFPFQGGQIVSRGPDSFKGAR